MRDDDHGCIHCGQRCDCYSPTGSNCVGCSNCEEAKDTYFHA